MTAVTADLTNLPAVNAGETKREFATRLGYAKAGRGRFGANALAVIAAAEAAGGVFSDPAPKPAAPKPTVTPAQVQAALNEQAATPRVTQVKREKPAVSQQTAERITPLAMPKRKQTVGYVTERNTLIAFTSCASKGGCGKAVNMCACASGPKAPHYLDKGVAGTPLLLTKPVV